MAASEHAETGSHSSPHGSGGTSPDFNDVEQRTVVSVAVVVAMAAQSLMPSGFRVGPVWSLPATAAALIAVIFVGGRRAGDPGHPAVRALAVLLAGVLAIGNIVTVITLVHGLLWGYAVHARQLFAIGIAAWITNVVAFAVAFWEIDAGGPVRRATLSVRERGEFLFPQYSMAQHSKWTPRFLDYLYVSFTNATAFSPTDTLPLSSRAKALMAVQSAVALVAIAVVFARGVNIIGA